MKTTIYDSLAAACRTGEKKFAVLIDPDQLRLQHLDRILELSVQARVDYFLIGGSLVVNNMLNQTLLEIKRHSSIPAILFPGNSFQISTHADAMLFLSLISGRNPELLIGKQVIAAPYLKKTDLEIISTGYVLIDGGIATTASYMSNTNPIPHKKNEIALCTALAGQFLGMKLIYLDAGSGALQPVSADMIQMVREGIDVPLIVGGGIKTPEKAIENLKAGADLLVVGDAIERHPDLIPDMAEAIHSFNKVRV